ncbi:DUF2982 domain-containing protein [Thalassotalea agarivorans]|uniref:DUF2982 domain-containing protein n=1 Tax=Thalassotalea agarivorans TaxID=349064 RepID=A0A1I0BKL9_THASX|nr:DUF2982 domain-containing protein [Thalassotalea agarivorans]SET07118.1 Protein of unknown function [Thalassotalea agarivorans]
MSKAELIFQVKPISRHHGLFVTLVGLAGLLTILLVSQLFWMHFRLPLIFLTMAALVTIFIGLLKLTEPKFSYEIYPDHFVFIHRAGSWALPWLAIGRVAQVKLDRIAGDTPLPYIGVKLTQLAPLAESISPRLANKLIHIQKGLLTAAIGHQQMTFEQGIINFEPFDIEGKLYKGPIGSFLHQCEVLNQAYGFHLYLPYDSMDREADAFVTALQSSLEKAKRKAAI